MEEEPIILWRVQYEDQSRDCDGTYLLKPHYVLAKTEDDAWNAVEAREDVFEGCQSVGVYEARYATEVEAAEWSYPMEDLPSHDEREKMRRAISKAIYGDSKVTSGTDKLAGLLWVAGFRPASS
jgi:hypothetical protein